MPSGEATPAGPSLPGFCFFVFRTHVSAMRTFDKLIATIPARRGAVALCARLGFKPPLLR